MRGPGFTAEGSIYRSASRYVTGATPVGSPAGYVEPQSFKSIIQGIGVGVGIGTALGDLGGGIGGAVGAVIGGVIGGLFCAIFDCA
jgi:hypothetical protein